MPPTGKCPKKTPIMTVGLPTGKKDKGKKKVISPLLLSAVGMRHWTRGLMMGVFTTPWMMTSQSLLDSKGSVY